MTGIKTTVAKSQGTKDAALNLNVKAYEVRRTLAAVWDTEPTRAQPPSPESAESLDMVNPGAENIVGEADERVLVDKSHFAPGGKYRCKSRIIAFIQYTSLTSSCSNCEAIHALRVPKVWGLEDGYRLAY